LLVVVLVQWVTALVVVEPVVSAPTLLVSHQAVELLLKRR
jgi:hypothetical protein